MHAGKCGPSVGCTGTLGTYLPGFGFCREQAEIIRYVLHDCVWEMISRSLKGLSKRRKEMPTTHRHCLSGSTGHNLSGTPGAGEI